MVSKCSCSDTTNAAILLDLFEHICFTTCGAGRHTFQLAMASKTEGWVWESPQTDINTASIAHGAYANADAVYHWYRAIPQLGWVGSAFVVRNVHGTDLQR